MSGITVVLSPELLISTKKIVQLATYLINSQRSCMIRKGGWSSR